jgi:metal-responsive CopG/Arc/MetJ family transcriptional regulator
MGRPSLHATAIHVRIPNDVLNRVDALVGDNQRAQFVREALIAEIERRERAASNQKKLSSGRKRRSA